MPNDTNICIFTGRLGKNPESRFTQSGKQVVNFPLAISKKWGGEESTTWLNIVAWNKTAEICEKYLGKGSKILVSGQLQIRDWEDKDGNKRYTTEIVIREMQMLDSKKRDLVKEVQDSFDGEREQGNNVSGDDIPF